MERQERIEKGYAKTKKAFEKMIASRNMKYTKQRVKVSHNLTLEIQCERDDGSVYKSNKGKSGCFQIYAIKNGEAVDCCTDHGNIDSDIKYLLGCYI